jgi:hypothetical protein
VECAFEEGCAVLPWAAEKRRNEAAAERLPFREERQKLRSAAVSYSARITENFAGNDLVPFRVF